MKPLKQLIKSPLITVLLLVAPFVGAESIKVGVITGKETELAEAAALVAKERYGLDVELLEFTDGVILNEALDSGELDLNAFQHKPFLDEQIEARGYKLVPVANTFVYPIAAYSENIKSLDELKPGSTITVPMDPTNLGRSLLLLEKQNLITLREGVGLNPTQIDIIDNPKNLNIVELEPPLLPASLEDDTVALSIINTSFSTAIGLTPKKDGIFVEDKDSPYVNIIVAREENKDNPEVKQFIDSFQSDEVEQAADRLFEGSSVKGW
ncbi:methionine ABC transporter substrate-binding lipoprotein MetQ [Thorsellia anophelis]|uniref:Lipoprotein n=1 Tax=Thorsellia anophelis DSM 18579 TaxID=1123402 RepID=A0A1I0B4R6_9GAMM|nr:methionine ABC transporter substrate-binding lipoprotein MetQ [Thorsellia anophelis]SET01862.1 D-methionine transport system substrate-binding protein [Thorsellia anophelis DSM 18579]